VDVLLNILVCFGLTSVGLAFIVLLPVVGNLLVSVFSTVYGEQFFARFKGIESGSVLTKPEAPPPPEPVVEDEDHGHQPTPLNVYLGVYGALLVLTVVTVGVSELGLIQREAVFWAVVVATMKGTLVVAWFMHMKGGPAMNRLILGTTLFFMLIFFTLTMADLATRDSIFEHEAHWTTIKEAQYSGQNPAGWSAKAGAAAE